MKHWTLMKALLVAITAATICSGCILPPTLSKAGLVCEAEEYNSLTHKHESTLDRWHIKANSTQLQMDAELPRFWRKFVDVLNYKPTDLQDIDMHVINRGKDPLPSSLGGCNYKGNKDDQESFLADAKLGKFVFAFGIHEIENNAGAPETKSPHMIVFLPLHTKMRLPPDTVQEFRILLLHMEREEGDCTGDEVQKRRCTALVRLRRMWRPGEDGKSKFKAEVARSIKDIIGPELRVHYHNGVIHGRY